MSVELNYKKIGDEGEVVLILHGLFGSLDNWQTMARRLSETGLQVYSVDLRNHGKSPHTSETSLQLMAEDVEQFINSKDLENITLIGHSMGGKTAMQLAMNQPELLNKLVVVDIAPKPYLPRHNTYFEAMLGLDLASITSRRDAKNALGETVKNIGVLQFLLKNLDRKKEGGFEWKFNLHALYNNYENLLSGLHSDVQFNKPTLFMKGGLSDYLSQSDLELIQTNFPNAVIETIDGAGHWVHAEAQNEFFTAITNFNNSQ